MPHPLLQAHTGITSPTVPQLHLKNYARGKLLDPVNANTRLSDKLSSTGKLILQIHEHIKTSVESLKRNMLNARGHNQIESAQTNFVETCHQKPDTYKNASDGLVHICLDDIRQVALGGDESAQTRTIEKGLDVMVRDFSPVQVDVHANDPVNDSVHPLAGKLFTEGAAHIQTLHLALQIIKKTMQDGPQQSTYLKQLAAIIQNCATYYAQDACVEGKLSELQRAATRARQLLSNDVLKSMLRKQFTDILINVTQSTLVNSDTSPIAAIVEQEKKKLKKTLAERAPQLGFDYNQLHDTFKQLDLTAKETRDWFSQSPRGNIVHRVNALMGSLNKDLPLEETKIVDGYAEDLTLQTSQRTLWINTAYRRLLNQHLARLEGALHPLTVIDHLTEELIQNIKNSTPNTGDSAFYPAVKSALASLEPALGEIDIELVIDLDPMKGTCHWNENLHLNLSNLITQTAWKSGLIHPDFTVAIDQDNRIIAFDRDKALHYGGARSLAQTHPFGLLVFTDHSKNEAPKFIKVGEDAKDDQTTNDPTYTARAELAFESALALTFNNPLAHEAGEIIKRLNIAAHAADEPSRNALYGDRQKLVKDLSKLFESHLRKPEDLKKSTLSDLTQKLFQKEHHELLSTLLSRNRAHTWVKLLERALSDAALTDQYPELDKTAIRQFLITHGKHILDLKAFAPTQYFTVPQYNLDALLAAENADVFESLLETGLINVDLRTDQLDPLLSNGKTLLIHAIKHGSPRSVELLCGYGASAKDGSFINQFSGQKRTLLATFEKHAQRFSEPGFISRCVLAWMQKKSKPSLTATLRP